ncbi:MAG TPA: hypothetical protein ENN60_03255 [archaeon]|nr:hypothetical protein [archaeon]
MLAELALALTALLLWLKTRLRAFLVMVPATLVALLPFRWALWTATGLMTAGLALLGWESQGVTK